MKTLTAASGSCFRTIKIIKLMMIKMQFLLCDDKTHENDEDYGDASSDDDDDNDDADNSGDSKCNLKQFLLHVSRLIQLRLFLLLKPL